MQVSPAQLGFLRAIGTVVLFAVLNYIGDASHLNGIFTASTATLIAGAALSIEHYIEASTGKAIFGTSTVTA